MVTSCDGIWSVVMRGKTDLRRFIVAGAVVSAMAAPSIAQACTSLLYKDGTGAAYAGRTLELSMELPYKVAYFPAGTSFGSKAGQHHVLDFTAKNAFVAIGAPDPANGQTKVVQGVNDKGLTFSMLAFPSADGPADAVSKTTEVLAAIDLGSWTLSKFDTVAEVKEALEKQAVILTSMLPKGGLKTPFHYALHDATGHSIVIEYSNGVQHVYDNPVGVMTNGPTFPWHMTNLDNYTYLNNKDHSSIEINGRTFNQPDSGIATIGIPGSNTSVGRFVKAVYYTHFAEKVDNPDAAIKTLGHIMNNFDRPRGITIDKRTADSIAGIKIPGVAGNEDYVSEYTSWTTLTDLNRHQMYVRTYNGVNYTKFDLNELKDIKTVKSVDLNSIPADVLDGSQNLISAK